MVIDGLPEGLKPQLIAPDKHDPWARNETCFNVSSTRFATALNIVEATMMNEMGQLVWGEIKNRRAAVTGRLKNIPAYCWSRPFAHWLNSRCFVVKVAPCNSSYPLIAIHFDSGFQVLRGFGGLDTRPKEVAASHLGSDWLDTEDQLIKAISG